MSEYAEQQKEITRSIIDQNYTRSDKQGSRQSTIYDTDWMAQGNCVDKTPATFFPSDGKGVDAARRICAECVVKEECLDYALANKIDHGVWGGTSERERRRIFKALKISENSHPEDPV